MSLHIPVTSMVPSNVIPDAQILSDALQLAFYQLGDGLFRFPGNTTVNHVSVPTYTLNSQVIPGNGQHLGHLSVIVRQSAGLIAGVVISSGNASQFNPAGNTSSLNNIPTGVSYVVLTPESYEGTDGVMRLDFTEGDLSIQATPPVLDSNGRVQSLVLAKLTIPPSTSAIISAMITDMRQFLSQPGIGISISGLPTAGQVPVATGVADEAIWSSNAGGGNTSFELVTESLADGTVVNTIPTGANPAEACFDGTNVWVANSGDGTLTKILASTGAILGTFPGGDITPNDVCSDGVGHIWVTSGADNTVSKILISSGAILGTFATGNGAGQVCVDGAGNVWVCNAYDNTVTKFLITTGATVGTFPTGNSPSGICFDNAGYIWISNYTDSTVTKLLASTGALAGTFPTTYNPSGICFDGSNIWTCSPAVVGGALTKIQASTGSTLGVFPDGGVVAYQICSDGTYIWGACPNNNAVLQVLASSGEVVNSFPVGAFPSGIVYGDGFIWVTNLFGNTVSELTTGIMGTAPTSSSFPGTQGQVAYDSSYLYLDVAPNTWARLGLSSF